MDKEIIKKALQAVQETTIVDENDAPSFPEDGYTPVSFSSQNAKEIKPIQQEAKIAFIDGGNTEIICSSQCSLQLIRIYYCIYQKNKRIASKKHDFFLLTRAFEEDQKRKLLMETFNTDLFPKNMIMDAADPSLRDGSQPASCSKMGNIIRRFAEIKVATQLTDAIDANDSIILDGTLQATLTNEQELLDSLFHNAKEKKIAIAGLAKTNTLITIKGTPVTSVIEHLTNLPKWYYHPLVNITSPDHKAELYIIKLHESAKHRFRLEIDKEHNHQAENLISLLAKNAKDPVFLGYPYGLIDADRFARVSNKEQEYFKTLFMTHAGKDWQSISQSLANKDAHQIIDAIG